MLHRFYGGVHLQDEKVRTHRSAALPLPEPPPYIVLPMRMHGETWCTPIVAVGDAVKVGQCVAEPESAAGAPIHAGVSGTVTAIEPRLHPEGDMVLSVVIENDGQDNRTRAFTRARRADELTAEERIALIRDAGVAGMGSDGTPAHGKLEAAMGRVDTLLINGAESEPYSTADHRLLLERTRRVIGGTRILMSILGVKKAVIGVEGNKVDAVTALQGLLPLRGGDMKVKTLHVRYPQGGEIQLVQRLTGRQVPPHGTTIDVGCVVFNAATAAAVHRAVREGRPLTRRFVTVSGESVNEPHNFLVPIGTPVEHIIRCAGGLRGGAVRVLMGGAMRGTAQQDLSVPVLKHTAVVAALPAVHAAARRHNPSDCIRCGRCVSGCPMRLQPLYLYAYAVRGDDAALRRLHLDDCIACGVCDYRCPAKIPLLQTIRAYAARGEEASP